MPEKTRIQKNTHISTIFSGVSGSTTVFLNRPRDYWVVKAVYYLDVVCQGVKKVIFPDIFDQK